MRPLSYEVRSRLVGGVWRPHAVARCSRCQTDTALAMPRDGHNPEGVEKMFAREGWKFGAWSKGANACAACVKRAEAARKQSEGGVVVHINSRTPAAPATATIVAEKVAAVSPAKRKQIRDLLDGNFDEEKGLYLDGYSDAKVAGEVDVPEAVVREVRETAFGPIKSSPELDVLRRLADDLDARIASQARGLDQVKADAATLRKRIDETRQRLGVPAAA